jgi:hypothetical protein
MLTADMRTCQLQLITQKVHKSRAGVGGVDIVLAIDRQAYVDLPAHAAALAN